MDIRHMRLLLAVEAEGNLTRAAQRLHLTQPALSHQLRDLEETYGASLFHRLKRRMVLTPVGRRLWRSAETILREMERGEAEVRRMIKGDTGEVRLSTECYTSYHWLPRIIRAYRSRFPHVDIQIVAEATRRPLRFLLDGKLDVAITGWDVRRRSDPTLTHQWLFEDELVAVTSSTHPFAGRDYVRPAEFAGEHLLTYTLSPEEIGFFRRVLRPAGVMPRKVTRIELTEGIVEMVKADLGIAVMARWAIGPAIAAGRVRAVRITRRGIHRHWFATTVREKHPPGHLQSFIDHLQQAASRERLLSA